MFRLVCSVSLLTAFVLVGTSPVPAADGQRALFPRTDPHCERIQGSSRSPAVRGQTPFNTPVSRGIGSLPRGRAFYNNRYFGNFNNRFYGPQYGYF